MRGHESGVKACMIREAISDQQAQLAKQGMRMSAAKLTPPIVGLASQRCHLWGGRA